MVNPIRSFGELVVVELLGSVAGAYTGKLFADLGAQVVLVDPAGRASPGRGDAGWTAGADRYLHAGKDTADGDAGWWLERCDVVIDSSAYAPLAASPLATRPDRVDVRISPFAAEGPYAGWVSTDLTDTAIAGHLRLSGDPRREPLQGPPAMGAMAAGVIGFIGAMAALIERRRSRRGQTVEVNHHEVLVALHQFTLLRYTHNGAVLQRHGNRLAGPGSPIGNYRCRDGWISLCVPLDVQMERLLEVCGLNDLLQAEGVSSVWDVMMDRQLFEGAFLPYLAGQEQRPTVELFQDLRIPAAPVSTMQDLLDEPHLAARGFWTDDGDDGAVRWPGRAFTVARHDHHPSGSFTPPERHAGEQPDTSEGPLAGVRVLDLSRVWAGPLAARILADLGAEVLMVEAPWTRTPRQVPDSYVLGTHFFPDDDAGERPWNRMGFLNKYGINKRSLVVEMDRPEGLDLLRRLVGAADVLIENFSPRVMPNFGLDEDTLAELNPTLVYVTMPGYGRTGPKASWVAYGPIIDGDAGLDSLCGYEGEGPWKCGIAWPDPIAGIHAAAATLATLYERDGDPDRRGGTVEVAQIEATIAVIGGSLVERQLLGEELPRLGNRTLSMADQGVYPCAGDDRWIAVSVVDDAAWRALCDLAGWSELAGLSARERFERREEIDRQLAAWTAGWDDVELMWALQAQGVAAGAVLDAAQVVSDPQLRSQGFFVPVEHPEAGTHDWNRLPLRLSATPPTVRSPAPCFGEHNRWAAVELAGLDEATYEELSRAGVLRTEPPA